jgi:tRNA threonylcarbamoyladenosine biosynthesis protein TsaB
VASGSARQLFRCNVSERAVKLLALSTSTSRGSAALLDAEDPAASVSGAAPEGVAGRVLAAAAYVDLGGHAERIFGAIDEVLRAASVPRAAVGLLGCDVGPGSFTGVRVAVAAAKGIALALGAGAAGVTSLEAMAAAAFAEGAARAGDLLVPLLDARKGEVFLAAFDAPGAPPLLPPRHVPREAAFDALAELAAGRRLVVVGEVAEELAALRAHRVPGASLDAPDAVWIGRVALGRLGATARVERGRSASEHDPARLEPLYVRAPDAKPAELG